jgi:hypothetical protein
MPYKKGHKGALMKPLIVYRIKIIRKDPEEDEELTAVEDILDSEDFIEVLNDIHACYTWIYEIYEMENMGKIELWSKKDFRTTMNVRGFLSLLFNYGENLHL